MILSLGLAFVTVISLLTIGIGNGNSATKDWYDYGEPEGRFALKYPSSWLLGQEFDIMNPEGLKFYLDPQDKSRLDEIMQVGIGHRDPSLSTSLMKNVTKLRLDAALFINKFKDDYKNFLLLKYPDFNYYSIDGHRSFFFEFSFVKFNLDKKGLFVATDINNSIFYLLFIADQKGYDTLLPVMENIITSIKIKNI